MIEKKRRQRPVLFVVLRSLAVLGIFFGVQSLCTILCVIVELLSSIDSEALVSSTAGTLDDNGQLFDAINGFMAEHGQELAASLAWGMAIASLVTAVILWGTRLTAANPQRPAWRGVAWGVMLTIPAAIIANVVIEFGNIGMSDELSMALESLATHPVGILAVCLLGPIAEEIAFRSGILGMMLRKFGGTRRGAVLSVLISGLIFGSIHGNPSQFVGAGTLGVVFGWVYYRTGSVLPCIIMHVLNNSMSIALGYLFPDDTFISLLGGDLASVYLCLVSAVALYMLIKKTNHTPVNWTDPVAN